MVPEVTGHARPPESFLHEIGSGSDLDGLPHDGTHQEPHSYESEEQQIKVQSPGSVLVWTANTGGRSS